MPRQSSPCCSPCWCCSTTGSCCRGSTTAAAAAMGATAAASAAAAGAAAPTAGQQQRQATLEACWRPRTCASLSASRCRQAPVGRRPRGARFSAEQRCSQCNRAPFLPQQPVVRCGVIIGKASHRAACCLPLPRRTATTATLCSPHALPSEPPSAWRRVNYLWLTSRVVAHTSWQARVRGSRLGEGERVRCDVNVQLCGTGQLAVDDVTLQSSEGLEASPPLTPPISWLAGRARTRGWWPSSPCTGCPPPAPPRSACDRPHPQGLAGCAAHGRLLLKLLPPSPRASAPAAGTPAPRPKPRAAGGRRATVGRALQGQHGRGRGQMGAVR